MQTLSFSSLRIFHSALVLLALWLPASGLADQPAVNVVPEGNFENIVSTYVPWAGVDGDSNIHGIDGKQIMVGDQGNIAPAPFAPSAAVGDFHGTGKNDLILADSYGFFWYFPNTGTAQTPAFTQGEVIPIWLGEDRTGWAVEGYENYVPRIQLVDLNGSHVLDLIAGTYAGKLFHVLNAGSTQGPLFLPTKDRDSLVINTHKRGLLWCDYLAPFLTTAFNTSNLYDLVMGEGTYSANSIYLLRNTDSNGHPAFDEDHFKRIIPGLGLEQLTPNVVDWDNDGKPDVISGDRTGYINLFLNNSTDPANPTFAPGVHVMIGGTEQIGRATTVSVCDLSGNHLPNLLIGTDNGTVLYAVNRGTLGHPLFNTPALPLKGVLPPAYHYLKPSSWTKSGDFGAAYELIGCTNPQLEPGFSFPEDVKSKYALKFSVWPYKNLYFQRYQPEENEFTEHVITCNRTLTLKMNTRYKLSFWIMAPGSSVSQFRFLLTDSPRENLWTPPGVSGTADPGSSWTQVTKSFEIENDGDPTLKFYNYRFAFHFQGQSTFYLDDVRIEEEKE